MTATARTQGGGNLLVTLLLAGILGLGALTLLGGGAMMGEMASAPAQPKAKAEPKVDPAIAAFWNELDAAHQYDAALDAQPVAWPVNLPVLRDIGDHARERHPEAMTYWQRFQRGEFWCLEVFLSLARNRLLWRLTFLDTSLQFSIVTTCAALPRTALLAQPAYWQNVLERYDYNPTPVWRLGQCAQFVR